MPSFFSSLSALLALLITIAPLLVVAAFGINLSTKHVEAIADMQHGIRVDTVVARVTTAGGIDPALVVALLP